MVGVVLVSHSHALALATEELVRAMAGDALPLAIAAGTGEDHRELGTNALEIMEAIQAVMSSEGVVVLLDIGSALLSTETALGFLDDETRARVRCLAAPFIEGAVAAGVSASLGHALDEVSAEAQHALKHKIEHLGPGEPSKAEASLSSPAKPNSAHRVVLTIRNIHGLHARPAARFVREAAKFRGDIEVRNLTRNRGPAPAQSVTGLAALEVLQGDEIEIIASGPEAEVALEALRRAIESGLGDMLGAGEAVVAPGVPAATGDPIAVSPGLAAGPLFFVTAAKIAAPQDPADNPNHEIERLRGAVTRARESVLGEATALRRSLSLTDAEIFEAQALLLEDPELLGRAETAIRGEHRNAAHAWSVAFEAAAAHYASLEDEYLRERAADVRDIGRRVLSELGVKTSATIELASAAIVVVDDLTPAEVMALPATVLGVICLRGGRTSHAAILLRARGIPAIANAAAAFGRAGVSESATGQSVALDGETGELWLRPDAATLEKIRTAMESNRRGAEDALRACRAPAVTTDGRAVAVMANLSRAAEAEAALERGAEGVGLFRTEFLFLDRATAPGEEEQFTELRRLCEAMGARPVIVRTIDIGGDKPAPYLGLVREANPFLGERGIRVCLSRPELFQTQLRAILRAGAGGDFRLLLPMISEVAELRAARVHLEEAHAALERSSTAHAWPIPVGVMIEVPSAVLLCDQLAAEADFFSIGTNDLTQYLLAADRGNPALSQFQDALHPAVLKAVAQIVAAARRHEKPIAVCGEAAADSLAARLLVGLGVDELSLSPARIPAIKAGIRAASNSELKSRAARALEMSSAAEVRQPHEG